MHVKIYQPAKTAMQSKMLGRSDWIMEFVRGKDQYIEPLMHWTGSTNTRSQLKLKFSSRDAAIAYAVRNKLTYVVQKPQKMTISPKSYQSNFT